MVKSKRNVNQITSLDAPDLLNIRKSFQQAVVPRSEVTHGTLIIPATKSVTVADEDPGQVRVLAGRNTDLRNPFEYDPVPPEEFIYSDEFYGDESFEQSADLLDVSLVDKAEVIVEMSGATGNHHHRLIDDP